MSDLMKILIELRANSMYYIDFYLVAKEKSFAETSRIHHISTSSLTRNVAMLEQLLNLKLVKTSNKGFNLTLDGERLYKKLDLFFRNIEEYNLKEISKNLDIVLTIGTTRNIADYTLPRYLNKFINLYPNVKINIIIDSATNLNEYLLKHKIDILIDYLPHINFTEKYELEIIPITSYKTCFACSKKYYEKIKNNIVSLKDLKKYKLVISGSSRRRQMLDELLQKNEIDLIPLLQMPDSRLMAELIKTNDFIGYFIEDEIKDYNLKKINIKEEMPINNIGIIYSKQTSNNITKKFVEMYKNI